jgi:hypothetical protein
LFWKVMTIVGTSTMQTVVAPPNWNVGGRVVVVVGDEVVGGSDDVGGVIVVDVEVDDGGSELVVVVAADVDVLGRVVVVLGDVDVVTPVVVVDGVGCGQSSGDGSGWPVSKAMTTERIWASWNSSPMLTSLPGPTKDSTDTLIGFCPVCSRSSSPGLETYLQTKTLSLGGPSPPEPGVTATPQAVTPTTVNDKIQNGLTRIEAGP